MFRRSFVFTVLLILASASLLSCSRVEKSTEVDPAYRIDIPNPNPDVQTDILWASYVSFEDSIRGDAAFIGTFIGAEQLEDDQTHVLTTFRVDEVLYGGITEQEIPLVLTMGVGGCFRGINAPKSGFHPGYKLGNQYLIVLAKRPKLVSLFTQNAPRYYTNQALFLDLTDRIYLTVWEKLNFRNSKDLCTYVRDYLAKTRPVTETEGDYRENGTWETADFIAEVQLVEVENEASRFFSGNCYKAEVVRMIRGEEKDLLKTDGKHLTVTLEADKTSVGNRYIIGFSHKTTGSIYLQEGSETVCSPEDFDPIINRTK